MKTLICALTVLAVSTAQAATVHVDVASCPGPGSGSVRDPYCSIQTAIDNAVDTDEIVVAAGTYFEAINFLGKAITVRSSDGPEVTTIDGTGNFHVVQCVGGEGSDTILDGFTITGGNANGMHFPDIGGGGMINIDSSPTVTNCTFTGNNSIGGGAMSNYIGSSPTVTNCTFDGNSAGHGGGMYNDESSPSVTGCMFSDNVAGLTGGGMYNSNSSPTVARCTFSGNSASNWGGGMYDDFGSHPTVTGCTFEGNTAARGGGMLNEDRVTVIDCLFIGNTATGDIMTGGGGGIHDSRRPIVTNCTFVDNHARYGGGMVINIFGASSLVIPVADCTFIRNTADDSGGGLWLRVSQPNGVALTNCIFNGNVATNKGGGMYNVSGGPVVTNCTFASNTAAVGGGMNNEFSRPRITYCDFIANSATSLGGGMFNLFFLDRTVTDCLFDGNTADDFGGAVFNSGSDPTLINCTFSRNDAGAGSAVANEAFAQRSLPTLINCVVWGNTPNQIVSLDRLSATTVLFSDVEGGWSGDGSNNIDADPLFVDPDTGDYRLQPGSPCIDAGDNTAVPEGVLRDLDGNPRFVDSTFVGTMATVDMGAYEFQRSVGRGPRMRDVLTLLGWNALPGLD